MNDLNVRRVDVGRMRRQLERTRPRVTISELPDGCKPLGAIEYARHLHGTVTIAEVAVGDGGQQA